ncbi:TetR/AcrR family transcriptional regulator [Microbacterium protaetiae]|uniref:TetR/AcrR family transcriptional regulator n=1 Tax=Microbacterium protaetiae TaxID=2509458 RepID=UPI001A9163A8|nr:TetR/AcrR family transcriptional regulator [Microbacterium protaetiae]
MTYAARGLFIAQGYGATTTDAIAKAAGVSRATFYLHFRSKAEIVLEQMRKAEPDILSDYRALATVPLEQGALKDWLLGHAETWRRYRIEFSAIAQAMAAESSVADEWFESYGHIVAELPELVARLVESGLEPRRANARLTALAMTIDRAFYFGIIGERPEFLATIIEEIAATMVFGLGSPLTIQ